MRRPGPGRDGSAGFVLVEALAALTLIALTLATLASTLTFGRRVLGAGKGPEAAVSFAAGSDAIGNWLAAALAVREKRSDREGPVLFEGDANAISFVTLSNGDAQPGGMLAIALAYERSGGGVVFSALPLRPGAPALLRRPDASELPLLRDVEEVRFSYFGSPAAGAPPAWHDRWSGATRLPYLVRMRAAVRFNRQREEMNLFFRTYSR